MDLVSNFLQEHKADLLNCISDLKKGKLLEEDLEKLVQIENEWKNIPLEEREIPYQDGEKEFWFAYRTLCSLLNPRPLVNPRGEILSKKRPAWDLIRGDLEVAEEALRNNAKLPEEVYARRLFP